MYEPGTFDLQVGAPVTDADSMLSCMHTTSLANVL